MNVSQYIGGEFLKAENIPAEGIRAVIVDVRAERISEETRKKVVLYFSGVDKALPLNNTNLTLMISRYGEESDAWIGKKILIYRDEEIMYGGKRVGGVRIKLQRADADPKSIARVVAADDNYIDMTPEQYRRAYASKDVDGY